MVRHAAERLLYGPEIVGRRLRCRPYAAELEALIRGLARRCRRQAGGAIEAQTPATESAIMTMIDT